MYTIISYSPTGNTTYIAKLLSQQLEDKIKFAFKCSMCMRCIYNCPTKAISPYVSKFLPLKGGYSLDKYLDK